MEMHTFRPESDNTTFVRLASVENLHVDGQTKAAGAQTRYIHFLGFLA